MYYHYSYGPVTSYGYSYDSQGFPFASALAVNVVVALLSSFLLAVVALRVLARWHIYKKAGVPEWKSLIPVLNLYEDYKLAWNRTWAWVFLGSLAAGMVLSCFSFFPAVRILSVILGIFVSVIEIIKDYKMSKAFGHGTGWTFGLIFFETIFLLMIGLGKSEYHGPYCCKCSCSDAKKDEEPKAVEAPASEPKPE